MAAVKSVRLTANRLREALRYDAETGVFTWAIYRRGIKTGALAGCMGADGYWRIRIDGELFLAHRLAWLYAHGEWPANDIDHINGKRADNRISNLRDVLPAINAQNLHTAQKNNRSGGPLGTTWDKVAERWRATIWADGRRHHLGFFDSGQDAHQAYLSAKRALHPGCTI